MVQSELGGGVFTAKMVETLRALRVGGKPMLSAWLLETMLNRAGLSIRTIMNAGANTAIVAKLTAEERMALKNALFEFSISAFYTSMKPYGFDICEMLLFDVEMDGTSKAFVSGNVVYYAPQLTAERFFSITTDMPFINEALGLRYRPNNPSIVQTPDGYTILLRGINHKHEDGRDFRSLADDQTFRSRYFVLKADRGFNVLSRSELSLHHVKRRVLPNPRYKNEGIEDARAVLWNSDVWFTASAYDQSEQHAVSIVLCRIASQPDSTGLTRVVSWTPLQGPDPHRDEKNWLPYVHQGELRALYSLGPPLPVRVQPASGQWLPLNGPSEASTGWDLSRLRGSAGPLPFPVNGEMGQLCVAHEVSLRHSGGRWYVHRFVWLDSTGALRRVSHMFFFDHLGVEYCCGMAPAHDTPEMLLTVGVEEGTARMYGVSLATIAAMLKPIPSLM